jgi:mannose-6-phosphate isomerase-like protein (cupin superfamily)
VSFFGEIEFLNDNSNLSTIYDGRGGIFSWVPQEDIKEFTFLFFHPNKLRGNHYHPEFTEYFLVVEGELVLTCFSKDGKLPMTKLLGVGSCFRTPPGVTHAIHAITPSKCISLITKPWEKCVNPIIRDEIV